MSRIGRIVRSDVAFFYAALVLSIALIVTARLFNAEYEAYRKTTRDQITSLLQAKNFPHRQETHEVMLAAVLNIRDSIRAFVPSPAVRRLEDELHDAMRDMWKDVTAPASQSDLRGAESAYRKLDGARSADGLAWVGRVGDQIAKYRSPLRNEPIEPCSAETNPPLEQMFGASGRDPGGTKHMTSLHVPGLANSKGLMTWKSDDPPYTTRLKDANDVSVLLDELMLLVEGRLHAMRDSNERIVQVFFMSPDGMFRYWSEDDSKAQIKFFRHPTWTSSPFVMAPLEYLARQPVRRLESVPYDSLKSHLETLLGVPYIDYGMYGVVRTRTTPLTDNEGRLIGVFCTDVTIDLLPAKYRPLLAKGRNPDSGIRDVLFDWALVGSDGQVIAPSDQARVLERRSKTIEGLYSRAPRSSQVAPLEENVFAVPLGSEKQSLTLFLMPRAPFPPLKTLILLLTVMVAFLLVVALRIAHRMSERPREHEATILRDLRAGVVNIDNEGFIREGNDRAEEILGARFWNFGAEHDRADHVRLEDIVHDPILLLKPLTPPVYQAMRIEDVRRLRRAGLAFPYYARLRRPVSTGDRGGMVKWVRFKGAPVFAGDNPPRADTRKRTRTETIEAPRKRSIAVVQTVRDPRATALEDKWVEETSKDRERGFSVAASGGAL